MAIVQSIGSFAGKTAAYAWEGSKLASTQFAVGATDGYAEKAAELRARRESVLAGVEFTPAKPVARRQAKLTTA